MVIHVREAHAQMIQLMKHESQRPRGVIHCYTSDWTHAQEYLAMGFYLGFTGVVTFPPKKTDPKPQYDLLEVIREMPLDRMLVETDSPYLTPQIKRGERNEPYLVEEVVKKIAEVKRLPMETVSKQIFDNTLRLFDRMQGHIVY